MAPNQKQCHGTSGLALSTPLRRHSSTSTRRIRIRYDVVPSTRYRQAARPGRRGDTEVRQIVRLRRHAPPFARACGPTRPPGSPKSLKRFADIIREPMAKTLDAGSRLSTWASHRGQPNVTSPLPPAYRVYAKPSKDLRRASPPPATRVAMITREPMGSRRRDCPVEKLSVVDGSWKRLGTLLAAGQSCVLKALEKSLTAIRVRARYLSGHSRRGATSMVLWPGPGGRL